MSDSSKGAVVDRLINLDLTGTITDPKFPESLKRSLGYQTDGRGHGWLVEWDHSIVSSLVLELVISSWKDSRVYPWPLSNLSQTIKFIKTLHISYIFFSFWYFWSFFFPKKESLYGMNLESPWLHPSQLLRTPVAGEWYCLLWVECVQWVSSF
jgi:hypothetical protein